MITSPLSLARAARSGKRALSSALLCTVALLGAATTARAQNAAADSATRTPVRLHQMRVAPNPAWQCRPDSTLAAAHATDMALCDARYRVAAIDAALTAHQQLGVPDACARAVAQSIQLAVGTWALGDSAAARRAERTTCDGRTLTSDSLAVDEQALLRLCPGQVWSWASRGAVTCTALEPGAELAARHYSSRTRDAIDAYRGEMFSQARDAARDALSRDSLDVTAEAVLGASLSMLGSDRAAIASLRRAVRLDPSDSWAWGMLAWTLYTTGQDAAVDTSARSALALDGNNAVALQYLGLSALRRNDTATAVQALGRAAALSPANATLRADYARALLASGATAAAEREAREAVRLGPKYEPSHAVLGHVLEAEGRIPDAVVEYRRAHDLADWDADVAARLAALTHR